MTDSYPTSAPRYTRQAVIRRGMIAAGGVGAGLAFGAGFMAGVPGAEAASPAPVAAGGAPAMKALLAANLDFSFRLQKTLVKGGLDKNLFFSPLSISTALAMVYNGAAGTTQKAMAAATGFNALGRADVNTAIRALLAALRARDAKIALSIADSIWLRQGFTILPSFARALRDDYDARAQLLDFGKASAPGVINAWVKQQTHGLIPSIVSSIDPATVMFLINALYFKGAWSAQFNPSATSSGAFATGSGQHKTVPMMSQTNTFSHAKSASFEAIRLPYGNGQISMYLVLPPASSTLQAFVRSLNSATWTALVNSLAPERGSIQMPRFSASYGTSLKPALTALGMGEAFDSSKADFPDILERQQAVITSVQHKAIMKVDESGTLAAAVTSIGVGVTAVPISGFSMTVDRPFFCAIRDDVTGTLLFAGAIIDPS